MPRNRPKQALATREAHEALLELKKLVDEAAKEIHEAEVELFSAAITQDECANARVTLQSVVERFQSASFEVVLTTVREKFQTAVSA